YNPPPLDAPPLSTAPEARFVPAPADGVLPEGFFATTNLPTYVRTNGKWRMPRDPRMDGALVRDASGEIWVREGRRIKKGDSISVGMKEDGSEGILVYSRGFSRPSSGNEFGFMS